MYLILYRVQYVLDLYNMLKKNAKWHRMNVPMDIQSFKKIHCIGIGGIGVSATAKFFLLQGARVTGSDVVETDIICELRNLGCTIFIGHSPENIPNDTELVVYSPAVKESNPEFVASVGMGVPVLKYHQILGLISESRPTIAVTGMHGKSTTTSLVGLLFKSKDPLIIVGSKVKEFNNGNLQFTSSTTSPFIVEGDEYRGHMRYLSPRDLVITNIEEEHLDYYRDINHIKETFQEFVDKLPSDGRLYIHSEDVHAKTLITNARKITFGLDANADFRGIPMEFENGVRKIAVELRGEPLGCYQLRLPGIHNVLNSLAALAVGISNDISFHEIATALKDFKGIWRRFELVGECKGTLVYSDYGHHPTEINATLQGARELYPGRRIVLLFQPHQYDRTKKLFNQFIPAMKRADLTIIADVYDVPGREEDRSVNSNMLAEACDCRTVVYGGTLEISRDYLLGEIKSEDVIIIMGAGEVDRIAREIV